VIDQCGQPVGAVDRLKFCRTSLVPDVQQHRVWGEGVQPADDVRVDLVDAPAGVSFMVVVAKAGRAVELRSYEVHPVVAGRDPLPQADAIPTGPWVPSVMESPSGMTRTPPLDSALALPTCVITPVIASASVAAARQPSSHEFAWLRLSRVQQVELVWVSSPSRHGSCE